MNPFPDSLVHECHRVALDLVLASREAARVPILMDQFLGFPPELQNLMMNITTRQIESEKNNPSYPATVRGRNTYAATAGERAQAQMRQQQQAVQRRYKNTEIETSVQRTTTFKDWEYAHIPNTFDGFKFTFNAPSSSGSTSSSTSSGSTSSSTSSGSTSSSTSSGSTSSSTSSGSTSSSTSSGSPTTSNPPSLFESRYQEQDQMEQMWDENYRQSGGEDRVRDNKRSYPGGSEEGEVNEHCAKKPRLEN